MGGFSGWVLKQDTESVFSIAGRLKNLEAIMKFVQTRIPEVVLIEPDVFEDRARLFYGDVSQQKYHAAGIALSVCAR